MRILRPALVVLLLVASACGSNNPTAPTTTVPVYVTELFSGTLTSGGSIFYSFSLADAGTVSILLATTTTDTGFPLSREVNLGLGIPAGTGCALSTTVTTTAKLSSQITDSKSPSTYCVSISDPGTLTDSINFNIRITHP